MKKFICLIVAILLLVSLVLPVMAADDIFVPSIGYKGGPEAVTIELIEGDKVEGVGDCVVITSIAQAEDETTDISDEDRALLLEVYEKLEEGSMKLPVDGDYVIRELVDVSFEYLDCREIEEHNHKDVHLKKEDVLLSVVFDLQVSKGEEIIVLAYVDGEWTPIESVVNNGDGTITCVFEDICPVAFVVEETETGSNPKTGDAMADNMAMWTGMMVFCMVAMAAMVAPKIKLHK